METLLVVVVLKSNVNNCLFVTAAQFCLRGKILARGRKLNPTGKTYQSKSRNIFFANNS